MAFVNEKLTEKDKEFVASFKFRKPIGRKNELARLPENWSADRNNSYYLICLGGQGYTFNEEYPPYYYRLIIDNSVVEIEARFESSGDYNSGVKMIWRVQRIVVSNSLKKLPKEILFTIIKNAFISYGNIHKNGHVVSTDIIEMSTPFY